MSYCLFNRSSREKRGNGSKEMFKEMTAKDFLSPEKDKFLDLKIQPETKYGEIKVTTPECITVKI